MRVTEQMVAQACSAYWQTGDVTTEDALRQALTAALADVPESGAVDFAVEASTCIISLRERIVELEAQAQQMADVVVAVQRKAGARIAKLKAQMACSDMETKLDAACLSAWKVAESRLAIIGRYCEESGHFTRGDWGELQRGELGGEVCDGEHAGPCPAWHDGVDGLRQRIVEHEAQNAELRTANSQLASIGKDQHRRIAALEAKLSRIGNAHARYQRNALSQEEFEGTIAEIAEGHS